MMHHLNLKRNWLIWYVIQGLHEVHKGLYMVHYSAISNDSHFVSFWAALELLLALHFESPPIQHCNPPCPIYRLMKIKL